MLARKSAKLVLQRFNGPCESVRQVNEFTSATFLIIREISLKINYDLMVKFSTCL